MKSNHARVPQPVSDQISTERQARLARIARAFALGTYCVDADATAAKMIGDPTSDPSLVMAERPHGKLRASAH